MITDAFRERCFKRFCKEFPPKPGGEPLSRTLERFYNWLFNMHFVKADQGEDPGGCSFCTATGEYDCDDCPSR